MKLSKYGRKKMLERVALNFRNDQLEWLNQQTVFTKACATENEPSKIVELGKTLFEGKTNPAKAPPPSPTKFVNTIVIPDSGGGIAEGVEGVAVGSE